MSKKRTRKKKWRDRVKKTWLGGKRDSLTIDDGIYSNRGKGGLGPMKKHLTQKKKQKRRHGRGINREEENPRGSIRGKIGMMVMCRDQSNL